MLPCGGDPHASLVQSAMKSSVPACENAREFLVLTQDHVSPMASCKHDVEATLQEAIDARAQANRDLEVATVP